MEELQDPVSQRIKILIDRFANGVQRQFALRVGVNPTTISEIFGKRKNKPSVELMQKIVTAYPQLRTNWLLLGEGPMTKMADSSAYLPKNYISDILDTASTNEHIPHPESDRVAERPDPEVDWPERRRVRLVAIREEADIVKNDSQHLKELIREFYTIIEQDILKRAALGLRSNTNVMDFKLSANAGYAWGIIRSIPIDLYPQYPYLHFSLDFADPYRRIAVFIEEDETPWQSEAIEYEDRLLITHGWKVFRIPINVAKTYESDLLPPHLIDVYEEGVESIELFTERQSWDEELSRKTLDGFFRWLKKKYFKKQSDARWVLSREDVLGEIIEKYADDKNQDDVTADSI